MGQKMKPTQIHVDEFKDEFKWYTIVTKYNYEQKFASDLRISLVNSEIKDRISEILVPILEEKQEVEKNGVKKIKVKYNKVYPLYVFIKAKMNEDVWNLIRSTSGCSTILAIGGNVAITHENEIKKIKKECGMLDKEKEDLLNKMKLNEEVNVVNGLFKGQKGIISAIHKDKESVEIQFGNMKLEVNILDLQIED